jgi:hypothetical protein
MNSGYVYSIAMDYFIERLNLQDIPIRYERFIFDRDYLGCAWGEWNNDGTLFKDGNFRVEVIKSIDLYRELHTLAHELTHIRQYVDGTVCFKKGGARMYGGMYESYNYFKRQTEREANKKADILVSNFLDKHRNNMSWFTRLSFELHNIFKGRFL